MRVQRRPTVPRPSLQDRKTLEALSGVEQLVRNRTSKATAQRASKTREIEDAGTLLPGDYILRVKNAGAAIRLVNAALCSGGRYRIEDASGGATASPITITPYVGETISGASSASISADYGTLALRSDGQKWIVE